MEDSTIKGVVAYFANLMHQPPPTPTKEATEIMNEKRVEDQIEGKECWIHGENCKKGI